MRAATNSLFVFLVSLLALGVVWVSNAQAQGLSMNFYKDTCKKAEKLVRDMTWSRVRTKPTLAAKLLRLHFHDCFVSGCDGSVLLDAVNNTPAEKDARPNLSLEGFDLIDDIKNATERICPGIVSCADILSLAACDAVTFLNKSSMWDVPTGRRDGNVSLASEVIGNIPSPFSDFTTLERLFINKGLEVKDLVTLSGAHTIGVAHCAAFSNRLYNFTGKGDADPSLDATYSITLKVQCPNISADPATTVELDPGSSLSVDSNYFRILLQNKGLLQSDAALLADTNSKNMVRQLQFPKIFFTKFAESMKKLGAIGVLTGNAGEIRRQCRVVNPK